MTLDNRQNGRIPFAGVLLALGFGALLLWPAVVLGDSLSSGSPPSQYRGPSGDVQGHGTALFENSTSTDPVRSAEGWARWEFWFEYEKDALLRDAMRRRLPGTVTGPGLPRNEGTVVSGPTDADIRDRVLPALREAMKDSSPAVRAAAALALGEARDDASLADLSDLLRSAGAPGRRAAALGLGFLGGAPVVAPLSRSLEQDPDAGVRSLAAIGIGLAGDPSGAAPLRAALSRALEVSGRDAREVRAAAVTGLGLLRDRAAVPLLQRVLRGDVRDDRARAHAASALGRIADPAGLPPLLAVLAEDGDASVRRSAALALGAFQDPVAAAALLKSVEGDGDALVRGFAAVSYARSGGKAAAAGLVPFLAVRIDRSLRGFAAVALGLTGDPGTAAPVLRAILESRSEDSLRAAAAVGLGLLGDRDSYVDLAALSRDASGSPELRGYALLGAALTGNADATGLVKEILSGKASPQLHRAAALSAGVHPFPGSPGLLLHALLEQRDPTVRGAALLGIGLAPDRGGIPLLVDISSEESGAGSGERAAAVTALGQMTLLGALSPSGRLASGLNFHDITQAVDLATRVF